MKVKKIKCPNCDANISLKENATRGICEYCQSEFIIEDDTIKIEHTGTIEVTNDTSLKVAHTTLNQFKDYDRSLILYKKLIYKYAHKKEVYIGLIRSITKDFNINNINLFHLNEVNDYWKKYVALANDKEIDEYKESVTLLNKNYWFTSLANLTNNFNSNVNGGDISEIEKCYNNCLAFCNKDEGNKLDNEYKKYIVDYKIFLEYRESKKRKITILITSIAILLFSFIVLFFATESPSQNTDSIKLSSINYSISEDDYQSLKKYFKNTVSEMTVVNAKLNNIDKSVNITVELKNFITTKTFDATFDVIDDMGPIIESTSCSFTDTEEVDLYKCFTIYDFTDGEIDVKTASIEKENIDFKVLGTKYIEVSIKDKDGNASKEKISVIITKTPIQLSFNLNDKLIVGNTYTLSPSISPNNISDNSISYTYDNKLVSISKNKLKVLKKGKTEVCAVANYDKSIKQCKTVTLDLQCKDTYIFNFDGSREETITADEVFCPGNYKIYASVMNYDEFYHLEIKPKDQFVGDSLTVYKNSSYLNEEGKKYALAAGHTITTDIGITQIKLVKQK